MSSRRTQSYAAVPRDILVADRPAGLNSGDPEDFEPELPPSPTFWPREEKEPQR